MRAADRARPDAAALVWACEPSSPLGQTHTAWPYAPLRLGGTPSLSDAQRAKVWPLFSPNKALGLTGVRAAYAIAPADAQQAAAQLDAVAPSWVLGAHRVALLMAWTQADTQAWLHSSLQTLRGW